MERSRAAAVVGARRVLAEHGVRKATMGEVALRGGLAKATLYNHVRTKAELLVLVGADGRTRVQAAAADGLTAGDLAAALNAAATTIATDEVLVGVRLVEPAALLALMEPGEGPEWAATREAVRCALGAAGRPAGTGVVDLVLRWLLSFALTPGTAEQRSGAAATLAAALPAGPSRTTFAAPAR